MSDDLRYYFLDHEADEHPSIPADEGWKKMQQLLDTELPVSSKKAPRRYLFFITAALTGIIFLTTALPLKNYFEQKQQESFSQKKEISINAQNDIAIKQNNNNSSANTLSFIAQHIYNNNFPNPEQRSVNPLNKPIIDLHNYNIESGNSFNEENNIKNIVTEIIPQQVTDTSKNISSKKTTDKEETTASTSNKVKEPDRSKYKSWQLNVGVATNISLSNAAHGLQPYPFAELRYQFTPRFFAGASVALFSPVGSNANGIKKTVYVNDTSNNVSKYNETLNYKRLSYADLSLTAGVKLTKRLSLQSGVQFSRLLNTTTNISLDPYDFDMNMVYIQDVTRLPATPSAAPVYNNKIDATKLDIRYVAGINYDMKKLSIGLQYQGGLKPVLRGDAVTADKNKLLTLKVAYRFK